MTNEFAAASFPPGSESYTVLVFTHLYLWAPLISNLLWWTSIAIRRLKTNFIAISFRTPVLLLHTFTRVEHRKTLEKEIWIVFLQSNIVSWTYKILMRIPNLLFCLHESPLLSPVCTLRGHVGPVEDHCYTSLYSRPKRSCPHKSFPQSGPLSLVSLAALQSVRMIYDETSSNYSHSSFLSALSI